jgi:ATP-dependent helicase HepA
MQNWEKGQRWFSSSEIGLGLGIVSSQENRRIEIKFPHTGESRIYATENNPLQRFTPRPGDMLLLQNGQKFKVEQISEAGDLYYFSNGKDSFCESELADHQDVQSSDPFEKILKGSTSEFGYFKLRTQARQLESDWFASPVRGMIGPRVVPIPHQFYIAHRAATAQQYPRLLLCDEVGLGKTIEAGLIYHVLKHTGRVLRTLVVVPEVLKHQWMVEFYRRFNQMFSILDKTACESMIAGDKNANPFDQKSEVICDYEFLKTSAFWCNKLKSTKWDLVIFDEAHHLRSEQGVPTEEFLIAEALCKNSRGVLMLTGTPEQINPESHYARLSLLNNPFAQTFEEYLAKRKNYKLIAQGVETLVHDFSGDTPINILKLEGKLNPKIYEYLHQSLPENTSLRIREWVRIIEDHFGTGSSVFRNTRKGVGGFPQRHVFSYPLLPPTDDPIWLKVDPQFIQVRNPILVWLCRFLEEHPEEKVLCICASRAVVRKVQEVLPLMLGTDFVVFHEDQPLIARDRAAAWFADPKGAQLLFASEIGSEGRNFQFSHHLVLFDLPDDISLLEQRIGRLDRIGQARDISIHVPYIVGSESELYFNWYQMGLDAFRFPVSGSAESLEKFKPALNSLLKLESLDRSEQWVPLLNQANETMLHLRQAVESGRDILLELNSADPQVSAILMDHIAESDLDPSYEKFFIGVMDAFGLDVCKGSAQDSWLVEPGPHMKVDSFPGVPEDGITLTVSRSEALAREDVSFFSPEHPAYLGALDVMTSGGMGQASAVLWKGAPSRGIWLMLNYVTEYYFEGAVRYYDFGGPFQISLLYNPKLELKEAERQAFLCGAHENLTMAQLEKARPMIQKFFKAVLGPAEAEVLRQSTAHLNKLKTQLLERLNEKKIEMILNKGAAGLDPSAVVKDLRRAEVQLDSVCLIFALDS